MLKERAHFNNKVDIFAAGCILFELATGGKRAFASDFMVHEYSAFPKPLQIPLGDIDRWSAPQLSRLIPAMLNVDSEKRPTAESLRIEFSTNRAITIGEAWKERKHNSKAIVAYNEASKHSTDAFVFENLGHLYTMTGDYVAAISAYKTALKGGASVMVDLATVLCLDGQYDDALARYQDAINKDTKNARLWGLRGEAFLSKSDYDNAISMFQKAAKLAPLESFFREKLGEVYLKKGNIDASIKAYESAIKRDRTPALERALAEARAAKLGVDFTNDKQNVKGLLGRLKFRTLLRNQNSATSTSVKSQRTY